MPTNGGVNGKATLDIPFPAELVVIVIVLDPEIPLPAGPVTVIVTLIMALGNE